MKINTHLRLFHSLSKSKQVLVTGSSGYIGSQICNLLLQDRNYNLICGTTSVKNKEKLKPLQDQFQKYNNRYKFIGCNLQHHQSIIDAAQGCDYIIHTAQPFLTYTKQDKFIVKTSVEGIKSILQAAREHKVQRVVITSSLATICKQKHILNTYNESNQSDLKYCNEYEQSKFLVEQEAWNYIEQLPEEEKFDLVVLNLATVIGPQLINKSFTSGYFIDNFLNGGMRAYPKIKIPLVDVRDVAQAHLQALTTDKAQNKRFIISQGEYWYEDICKILQKEFKEKYQIPKRQMSYWRICLGSIYNKDARFLAKLWNKDYHFENNRSKKRLKMKYRPIKSGLIEMVDSMRQAKLITSQVEI